MVNKHLVLTDVAVSFRFQSAKGIVYKFWLCLLKVMQLLGHTFCILVFYLLDWRMCTISIFFPDFHPLSISILIWFSFFHVLNLSCFADAAGSYLNASLIISVYEILESTSEMHYCNLKSNYALLLQSKPVLTRQVTSRIYDWALT